DPPAAAPERTAHRRLRAERSGEAASDSAGAITPATRLPAPDRKADAGTRGAGKQDDGDSRSASAAAGPSEEDADGRAEPGAHADPVPGAHAGNRNRASVS